MVWGRNIPDSFQRCLSQIFKEHFVQEYFHTDDSSTSGFRNRFLDIIYLASNFAWYCRLQTPTMSDRKAELERKKQKLELMRKERQEKERLRKLKEVSNTSYCQFNKY